MNPVDTVVNYCTKYMVKSVIIEAGHVYVSEIPDGNHKRGLEFGGDLSERLTQSGIQVKRILFVDDYNPKVWSLDLGEYRELAKSYGYPVDITVTESSMAAMAQDVLENLRSQRMVVLNPDGSLHLAGSDTRLNGDGLEFSCSLIESALYLWKFKLADFCITVLPYDYKSQQSSALRIVKRLGYNRPPCIVAYTREGEDPVIAIHGVSQKSS